MTISGAAKAVFFWTSLISLLLGAVGVTSAQTPDCTIDTVAGGSGIARGDGGPATEAELLDPRDVRVGPDGLLYIADSGHHRIRRITADGLIETFAGSGHDLVSGDGGPPIAAGIRVIDSMAFGPDGSLYFLDRGPRIRKIDTNGTISTISGGKATDSSGDGGAAADAGLRHTYALAVGPDGSIYLAGNNLNRIRRILPGGRIENFAGSSKLAPASGGFSGDSPPVIEANLSFPTSIAVDSLGTVYFLENNGLRITRISQDGLVSTYLRQSVFPAPPDGTPRAQAGTTGASHIQIDALNRVYWVEGAVIRRVSLDDRVETVWSRVDPSDRIDRFSVGPDGSLYSASEDQVVVLADQQVSTLLAGTGTAGSRGDGVPAADATFGSLRGLAAGPDGKLYIGDADFRRVRVLNGGKVEAFAGNGDRGFSGDDGPAADASFSEINDVAVDSDGRVFVAGLGRVRKVDPNGAITTYAGRGFTNCDRANFVGSTCGDGGQATEADLQFVRDIETDRDGNLYILHTERRGRGAWIRKVKPDGVIETIPDQLPNGERAQNASAIGLDDDGNLLVSLGTQPPTHWRINSAGEFSEIVGANSFVDVVGHIVGGPEGNIYAADLGARLLRLTPGGILNSIVPPNYQRVEFAGDGGPAGLAVAGGMAGIALVGKDLYLADVSNRRIRKIANVQGCPVTVRPQIARSGVVSATFEGRGTFSPGSIISIFGARLGPEAPVVGPANPNRFGTEMAGVRVLVDGRPAPLLFVSKFQVNAVIPYATTVKGYFTHLANSQIFEDERLSLVQVEVASIVSEPSPIIMHPAAPTLFTQGNGLAAALNQDLTLNTEANPAASGSVVVLFGTGGGATGPESDDGLIEGSVLRRPVLPVEVSIDGQPAEVLYAGSAPGLVAGVLQINARLPTGPIASRVPFVTVRIGGLESLRRARVAVALP